MIKENLWLADDIGASRNPSQPHFIFVSSLCWRYRILPQPSHRGLSTASIAIIVIETLSPPSIFSLLQRLVFLLAACLVGPNKNSQQENQQTQQTWLLAMRTCRSRWVLCVCVMWLPALWWFKAQDAPKQSNASASFSPTPATWLNRLIIYVRTAQSMACIFCELKLH